MANALGKDRIVGATEEKKKTDCQKKQRGLERRSLQEREKNAPFASPSQKVHRI